MIIRINGSDVKGLMQVWFWCQGHEEFSMVL